jgi:SAM-dependent methyltransferase
VTTAPVNPFLWQQGRNPNKLRLIDTYAQGPRALDVGCGPGFYATYLFKKGFDVTAIDMEDRHAEPPAYPLQLAAVPPLNFSDAAFDTVLMFDILEHIPDESGMLRELRRVVSKRVILSVPADNDGELPLYGVCLSHHVDKTHQREYSLNRIRDVLEKNGFRIIHAEPQYPNRLPLVSTIFFRSGPIGGFIRMLTTIWLKVWMKTGMIRVNIPADWLVVAEPVSLPAPAEKT